jgi:Uma2 family endonuclease
MEKIVLAAPFEAEFRFSDAQLYALCTANKKLRIERDKKGKLIIMSPVFSKSGFYNQELNFQLGLWNHTAKLGYLFDSSTGFMLPDNSMRSPDGAFIYADRWDALPDDSQEHFAHIVPDFVMELRTDTDDLRELQEMMREWIENGVKLAWLIDIENENEKVYVYYPDGQITTKTFAEGVTGENILPNLEINFDFVAKMKK